MLKKPQAECSHATLNFGSGDYYLFCHECGAWWAMINQVTHQVIPEHANQGVGAQLSGKARVETV